MPKLLMRPTLRPDEWWDSYVARVLAANGHAPNREYMLGKLEPIVAQLEAEEGKRRAMAGDTLAAMLRTYSGWALPSWAVRGTKSATAYCAICFGEKPYVRLGWRLRAVTHCDIHDRALQTRCSACRRSVFHWDLARQVCGCGEALGLSRETAAVVTASEGSKGRESWLFSLGEERQAVARLFNGSTPLHPEALAIMALMGRLLPALADVRVAGFADETRTTRGFLKTLGLQLSPSLDSLRELVGALPSAAHLRTALNVILALRHAEQTARSEIGGLPLLELAEGLCALGASPEAAERRGLIAVGALQRGLVPLRVAAPLAGLSQMHLHQLMERGRVVPTRTFEVGERQHLFSKEQIQSLTRFRHKGYTYGNTFDLGVEGAGVHVLRSAGIVGIVPGNAGRTWLDGEELRLLLTGLSERAVEIQAVNPQMVDLGSRRIWRSRYIPVLKTLFVKLLAGEVGLWASGDRPGFARFYVGVDALELLHRGSVACSSAGIGTTTQPALALSGGVVAWTPTPTPRMRRPHLGVPPRSRGTSTQLSLDFA